MSTDGLGINFLGMAFRLVLLKTKMLTVAVDVVEDMMILMSLEPPFFPVEGHGISPMVGTGKGFLFVLLLN